MIVEAEGSQALIPRPRGPEGFDFWVVTLLILAALVVVLLMCCACVCGYLAHAGWNRRDKVAIPTLPARDAARSEAAAASGSARPEAQGDQLTRLLDSYTVKELREACRARQLPVGGLKADIIRRLTLAEGLPTPTQLETICRNRTTLITRGLSYPLALEDVLYKDKARAWLSGSAAELSRRP
jgi:hypothetical protein